MQILSTSTEVHTKISSFNHFTGTVKATLLNLLGFVFHTEKLSMPFIIINDMSQLYITLNLCVHTYFLTCIPNTCFHRLTLTLLLYMKS